MSGKNDVQDRRRVYIDILRIIGALLVIFNHVPGYLSYQEADTPLKIWLCMIASISAHVNWPIFFMVSGALLLPNRQNETIRETYRKRLLKFAVVLLVYQTALFLLHRQSFSAGTIAEWFFGVVSGHFDGAYRSTWYLYSYIAFLIMLPFLRKIAKGFDRTEFRTILFWAALIGTCFPLFRAAWRWRFQSEISLQGDINIPIMTNRALFLPLVGYYLDSVVDIKSVTGRRWGLLTAAAAAGILVSCAFCYYQGTRTGEGFTQDFNLLFSWLTTAWLFLTVKRLCAGRERIRGAGLIRRLGSLAFGVYLLEPVASEYLHTRTIVFDLLETVFPTMIVSVIYCFLAFAFCAAVTALLKLIPGVKKFI